MNITHKFLIVSVFSLLKRLLSYSAPVYELIKYIPILVITSGKVSKSGLRNVILLLTVILFSKNTSLIVYFIPLFLFFIFKNQFKKVSLDYLVSKTKTFFLFSVIYGLAQYILGYFPFEINWILSDLSVVNADNMLSGDRNIRPFSTYASVPDFSIICFLYLFYFFVKKKRFWIFLSLLGLLISGTRGVIVSTIIVYVLVFILNTNKKNILFYSLISSTLIYLSFIYAAVFLTKISNQFQTSRLLLYGTFNGRVENLINKFSEFEIYNLLLPASYSVSEANQITFDNMHVNIIFSVGLLGYILFFRSFNDISTSKLSISYFSFFVAYGMYNDMIFSIYTLTSFFVFLYAKK